MTYPGGVIEALESALAREIGVARVVIEGFAPIRSVGNARDPWRFDVVWPDKSGPRRQSCVMMVKALAGQLETRQEDEFAVLEVVGAAEGLAPRALWCDPAGDWFGRPCFITGQVAGTAIMPDPHAPADAKTGAIARGLARAAARLHRLDWRSTALAKRFADGDPTPAQIATWRDFYDRNRLGPTPLLDYGFAWLEAHAPAPIAPVLVHGDLRFGNLLAEGDRLTALVDWEMAHPGDHHEDIAWAFRRWWTPEPHLSLDAFIAAYEAAGGPRVDRDRLNFYRKFNEVKHAIISLTGARSFADGRTANLRLANRAATIARFMKDFLDMEPPC